MNWEGTKGAEIMQRIPVDEIKPPMVVHPPDAAGWKHLGLAEGDIEEVVFGTAYPIQDNTPAPAGPPGCIR
ncbi:MAG: hypothetical protein M0Z79_03190 [Nitrospiraceae bacterium]|nr:hypothetical protein [Nitrospiraceae bacterium]